MIKNRHEDRKEILKNSYKTIKKTQGLLELNFYVQKMMRDYPETYLQEIKREIKEFEKVIVS